MHKMSIFKTSKVAILAVFVFTNVVHSNPLSQKVQNHIKTELANNDLDHVQEHVGFQGVQKTNDRLEQEIDQEDHEHELQMKIADDLEPEYAKIYRSVMQALMMNGPIFDG